MGEHDSSFFRTFVSILIALFVFMIVIIFAAQWITDSSGVNDTTDQRAIAKINETIKPVAQVDVAGDNAAAASANAAPETVDGQAIYQQACFACHGTGAAGAPKFADKAAWSSRIAQGNDALYDSALNGKNAMPPRGGQAGLSDAAVKAAVDYMVSNSK